MTENRNFNWEKVYGELDVENMGWYWPDLDPDLKAVLDKLNIRSGSFLDIGTGPGTQANALRNRGFDVTATDISKDAILLAKEKFEGIYFIQDNILDSHLEKKFDYVFDRGVFHVFEEIDRKKYVEAVNRLITNNGIYFLKCFSTRNPETGRGPYLFSAEDLSEYFGNDFLIESIIDTVYHGANKPMPQALFAKMTLHPVPPAKFHLARNPP